MVLYNETPVVDLNLPVASEKGVRLLIKREDLNHPTVSGNKWWKLKYNLVEALRQQKSTLLTFGGAYSNHIYAVAAAANDLKLSSIGIIRGEESKPINPTLDFAAKMGMHLHFVSRETYRQKQEQEFVESLHNSFGDFFLIPEGGTNAFAIKGAAEFADKLKSIQFDHLFVPIGTGGTFAGLIAGFAGDRLLNGVPILKLGENLADEVGSLITSAGYEIHANWNLLRGYEFGGYAKTTDELMAFIRTMKYQYNLPLDHVYTGKMLFGVVREISAGAFPRGTTILAVHTGGLQAARPV